jgi:hypothetical protein
MALTTSVITGKIQWSQIKTNTGFANTRQGPDAIASSITPPVNTINEIFCETRTLAAAASHTYNLQALTNFFGEAILFTKVRALHLSTTGGQITLSPGAADPLTWFMGGTNPTLTLPNGSFITIGMGTNTTVSGSAKTLTIENTGNTSATYQITLVGGV